MGSPSVPQSPWTPSHVAGTDTIYAQNLQGLSGLAGQGGNLAGNVINNPYAGQALRGAQTAGNYLTGRLSPQLEGVSGDLIRSTNAGMPYARSILQTGFDPQNALYNKLQQQNQDQTLALEAAQGVSQSPYGAGVSAQSNQDFNLNWQNQQLARQQAALGAYGGYLGSAGQGYTTAGQLGSAGAGAYTAGSALPYNTYLGQQQAGLGALGGASNLYGNATNAAGQYLGLTNQQYQGQLQAYQDQLQQSQSLWGGLGSAVGFGADALGLTGGGLGSLLGGSSSLTPVSGSNFGGFSPLSYIPTTQAQPSSPLAGFS